MENKIGQNFFQVKDMTDEEKYEMYMKVPHEELVKMKIEEEKYINTLINKYIPAMMKGAAQGFTRKY